MGDKEDDLLEDSEVLAHIADQVRESGVTTRCAWCGRYRVGHRWFRLEHSPRFIEGALSHGICPDCIASLREQGLSV
jgi:hypothetical protein